MTNREFVRWNPTIGEKITGRILYFFDEQGTFVAIIRTRDKYFLLPAEVRDILLDGRPRDGSAITIQREFDGYQILTDKPRETVFETTVSDDIL